MNAMFSFNIHIVFTERWRDNIRRENRELLFPQESKNKNEEMGLEESRWQTDIFSDHYRGEWGGNGAVSFSRYVSF